MSQNESNVASLPFGISEADLAGVVIAFRVSSTKMFSGYDEIYIRGNGQVGLRAALRHDSEPAVRLGKVDPQLVVALLRYLAWEGMEGWDETYPSEAREYVGKLLQVLVRDVPVKQVSMCQPEFAEFSRAFGAIKMVAAMAAPEVSLGEFFKRI